MLNGHGVSKADIIRTIAAETEENEALFRQSVICCVDLDQAVDTIGNAKEADDWANRHHLQTLILVTADYHMPRALVLFHQHMPQRQIIPHAVATPSLQ
ncbi:MAG: YdcF family protein, partial [Alphaproteobacteria bacterium]